MTTNNSRRRHQAPQASPSSSSSSSSEPQLQRRQKQTPTTKCFRLSKPSTIMGQTTTLFAFFLPCLLLHLLLLSSWVSAEPPAKPEDWPRVETSPFDMEKCGVSKGCFRRCKEDLNEAMCYKYVSWKSVGDDMVEFELSAATAGWVALGFSEDNRLGDDDAVLCQRVDPNAGDKQKELGRVEVLHVRNENDVNTRLDSHSISETRGEYHMKRVRCTFRRKRIPERQKEKILDLSNVKEPHLWIATGPEMGVDQLPKAVDSEHPLPNTAPVDFTTGVSLSDPKQSIGRSWSPLLKAHVLTDLIAWVGFMSVYILLIAFYRGMWPNSSIRGEEVWLTWHRAFLYVTVILTIIGLLFWFLDLGWVWNWHYRHYPVLLIIVWVCVFLQPIILFFRPSNPDKHPCRNCIWEWIYLIPRAIGHICAVPAVFISFDLPRLLLPNYASWILFVFIIFFIIVQLILLILQCCTCKKNKERMRKWRKDLVDNPNLPRPQPVCHAFKSSLLWLYIFVLLVVLLVLSIIIIIW